MYISSHILFYYNATYKTFGTLTTSTVFFLNLNLLNMPKRSSCSHLLSSLFFPRAWLCSTNQNNIISFFSRFDHILSFGFHLSTIDSLLFNRPNQLPVPTKTGKIYADRRAGAHFFPSVPPQLHNER